MPGTNSFKVFDENAVNIMDDAAYEASTYRQNGAVGGIAPSSLHNKMYRQATIMAAALAQVYANKGYNVSDADFNNLVSVLSHMAFREDVENEFLKLSGGTMTGPLVLAGDPSANMQAATKKYADENGGINLWRPSGAYVVGDICYSKNAASYKYMECTVAGTTGATVPIWPAVGQTIVDGTVTWVVRDIRAGEQLGSIKPWLVAAAPPGWLALDTGALVSRATYPQLWAWVQANAPLITEAAWQAQAAAQSSVGAYSSGDGSTTFRLPRIVDYLRGGLAADVGKWQGDAIRNITGTFGYPPSIQGTMATGAFTQNSQGSAGVVQSGANNPNTSYAFNASNVVPTADENRPKTIHVLYCVKAFDAPTNQGLINITELANEVAGLPSVIVSSGPGWTKYSDGTLIQQGEFTGTIGNNNTLTFGGITFYTTYFQLSYPISFHNAPDTLIAVPMSGPLSAQTPNQHFSVRARRDESTVNAKSVGILALGGITVGNSIGAYWMAKGRWRA